MEVSQPHGVGPAEDVGPTERVVSTDVLVVGAGPAGAVTALLLARKGWRVTVVDRQEFPRRKPCGEFVNNGAMAALHRLGLLTGELTEAGRPIHRWQLRSRQHRATGRFQPTPVYGRGIPREVLDTALLRQAEREGVTFHPKTRFEQLSWGAIEARDTTDPTQHDPTEHSPTEHSPTVQLRKGDETILFRPTVLVGAGGLRCPVATAIGMPSVSRRFSASMSFRVRIPTGVSRFPGEEECGEDAGVLVMEGDLTLGATPVSADASEWNVTVVAKTPSLAKEMSKNPQRFVRSFLARLWPSSAWDDVEIDTPSHNSSAFHRTPARTTYGNTVLVGDAAGYYDPFTGQGIYQALRSAELAAHSLDLVLGDPSSGPEVLAWYRRSLKRERRRTHSIQRGIDWALQSGYRRRVSLAVLTRLPSAFDFILKYTSDADSELRHRPLKQRLR